jgi:transposase
VRWRCLDLRDQVAQRFTVTVHERTIGKWLRKLKFTRPAVLNAIESRSRRRG